MARASRLRYRVRMRKRPGDALSKFDEWSNDKWIDSYGEGPPTAGPYRSAGEAVKRMTVEELVEAVSRNPSAPLGQLAASELRMREAWQSPAKWALVVSIVALAVSIFALGATFFG